MAEKDADKVLLGNRIRELREAAGFSRERLAEAAGVSVRAIIKWELGDREPGWFNILAMCKALGISCEAFTREPAERPPATPGRPRKATGDAGPAAGAAAPRRPRGRPRKAGG